MHPILRNILAIILGWFAGGVINMGLVQLGHIVFPVEGLDPNDMEAMAEMMPTLSGEYFIFPFLAHALGTLAGALVAALVAANRKMTFAMIIGVLFFLGGITVNILIPAPTWFKALDLIVAYIPMALLGAKIAIKKSTVG